MTEKRTQNGKEKETSPKTFVGWKDHLRGECPSNALRVLNFASRASAAARQGPAGLKTAEISPPGGTPCHASGAKWPRPAVRQGPNGPQKGRALRAAQDSGDAGRQ